MFAKPFEFETSLSREDCLTRLEKPIQGRRTGLSLTKIIIDIDPSTPKFYAFALAVNTSTVISQAAVTISSQGTLNKTLIEGEAWFSDSYFMRGVSVIVIVLVAGLLMIGNSSVYPALVLIGIILILFAWYIAFRSRNNLIATLCEVLTSEGTRLEQ